jgi:hypothetical protein
MPRRRYGRPEPLDAPTERPTSAPYDFVPTYCPRAECLARGPGAPFRCRRHGAFRRKAAPHKIPRFFCLTCRRTFSTQTFSTTYYMKRPELLALVARALTNGPADRHLRRIVRGNRDYAAHVDVGAAASTITRLVPRLGRHAALVLAELLARITTPEPLVADDFETFAATQLNQVAVPGVVGLHSSWIYMLDVAAHRRGGRLTKAQRRAVEWLRAEKRLPSPAARAQAWERVLAALLERLPPDTPLHLASDASPAIGAAVRRLLHPARIRHLVLPNPPRRPKGFPRLPEARLRDAVMGEIDLLHQWFRHSQAHDRRETIAFPRSVNAILHRRLVFCLGRNVVQPRRERRRREGTAAMHLGLLPRPVSWEELLERRRFLRRSPPLPAGWKRAYFEQIETLGARPARRRLPGIHRS